MLQIECKKKHCCTGSIFTFFSFSFIVYFSHRWTQHGSGMGGKRVNEHKWSRECGPRLFFFSCHTFLSLCFHSCLHFLPFLVMKGSPLLSMVSVPKRKQPFRWADTISQLQWIVDFVSLCSVGFVVSYSPATYWLNVLQIFCWCMYVCVCVRACNSQLGSGNKPSATNSAKFSFVSGSRAIQSLWHNMQSPAMQKFFIWKELKFSVVGFLPQLPLTLGRTFTPRLINRCIKLISLFLPLLSTFHLGKLFKL